MTIVEPADFEEYEFLERRFWETLRQTFTRVLNLSIEPVDEYRASLLHSPFYERVLALHDDPLDVAAILAEITITPEILARYEALLSEISVAEEDMEIVSSTDREPQPGLVIRKRSSGLVSMVKFNRIMTGLGYRFTQRLGKLAIWELKQPSQRFPGLPEVVPIAAHIYLTSHRQRAYEKDTIVAVYNDIIALAGERQAPESTLRMVRQRRDDFIREFDDGGIKY
jgi:hypothetical protein